MLKKILFVASIVIVPVTSSSAGNNYNLESALIQSQSVYDWSRFYAGVQAGFGRGNVDWSDIASDPFFARPGVQVSHSPSGEVLGFFAGHNWRMDNYVFGVEAGALFGNMEQGGFYVGFPDVFANTANINSIVTVGPRVGIVSDNAFFYIEGGIAAAEVRLNHETGPDASDAATDVNTSAIHTGYYLGVGIEVELNSNWAFGIEYNRVELGDKIHSFTVDALNASGSIFISGVSVDILTARLVKSF